MRPQGTREKTFNANYQKKIKSKFCNKKKNSAVTRSLTMKITHRWGAVINWHYIKLHLWADKCLHIKHYCSVYKFLSFLFQCQWGVIWHFFDYFFFPFFWQNCTFENLGISRIIMWIFFDYIFRIKNNTRYNNICI